MGFVRYSFLICFFVFLVSPVMADECSKEDKDYADFWQNYYTPEDAYAFGLKVQSLVANQDLSGIFSLVQGELQNGPRKEFVANKTFKEVFDEEWISQVLGDNAPCSPVGWRGFMLGNGLIWYNKADDGWSIFSIMVRRFCTVLTALRLHAVGRSQDGLRRITTIAPAASMTVC